MIKLFIALTPVLGILLISEYLWRKKIVKGERARKFIHILAGIWMAFWPFYLPFDGIFILSSMTLVVLIYSRVTRLFHAIYAVNRRTYGDIFYAVALMICAYFGKAEWIFTTSVLLLALADGGAAVVGRFWGIKNQYFVFGRPELRKSIAGTAAYIVLAYVAIGIGWLLGGSDALTQHVQLALVGLPLGAAFLENATPYGLDNLITPVFATILLNGLL